MSAITSRLLPKYWPELGWCVLAAAMTAVMVSVPSGETVPFHIMWVSLTILTAVRLWSTRVTLLYLLVISVVSGAGLTWVVARNGAGIDETSEVPLMGAMFLATVWHAHRRHAAVKAAKRAAQHEIRLERERELVRDVSHELRTPITVAKGHAELIRLAHIGESSADDAAVILGELDRLVRLADRLLILAAADHPGFLRRTRVPLEHLIAEAGKRWSGVAARKWRVRPLASGWLLADEERLSTSLDALIENAVKFTKEDDAITIVGRAVDGHALIHVTDDGDGIAEEDLARIFDRFARGNTSAERVGTGLGLPIVKAIVEAHGGAVSVSSRVGYGSTFELLIPGFEAAEPCDAEIGPFVSSLAVEAPPAAAAAGRAESAV